jgi:uncharacterized membrane protein
MGIYFLHVLFAFAAIAFLVVPGTMMEMAAHTRDVPFIRETFKLGKFHAQVGGPLALLAAVVGLILAWRSGVGLTAGWLVASYIVFVLIMVLGIGYHARREMRIGSLAQASPDGAPTPELAAAIDDPFSRPAAWASALLWILLIWLMVAKPF